MRRCMFQAFVVVGGTKERYQNLDFVRGGELLILVRAGLGAGPFFLHDRGRVGHGALQKSQVPDGIGCAPFLSKELLVNRGHSARPFFHCSDLRGQRALGARELGIRRASDENGPVGGQFRAPFECGRRPVRIELFSRVVVGVRPVQP